MVELIVMLMIVEQILLLANVDPLLLFQVKWFTRHLYHPYFHHSIIDIVRRRPSPNALNIAVLKDRLQTALPHLTITGSHRLLHSRTKLKSCLAYSQMQTDMLRTYIHTDELVTTSVNRNIHDI